MKILVLGAGSIGQRHLQNFHALGVRDLVVVDPDVERARAVAATVGARTFASLGKALTDKPDVGVICTPTSQHIAQAIQCARAGLHLFVEKPLSHTLDGIEILREEVRTRHLKVMVGSNLRFDGVYERVRKALHDGELGRVYNARFYFGHDLLAWRPGVDYRTVYSAHRSQGGGVLLDAGIHEVDLARSWFGDAARVLSLPRSTGALEADVEDVADLVLEFRSGVVASMHLNYRDPVYRRLANVAGDKAVCEADFARRRVLIRYADGREVEQLFDEDRNAMYLAQAQHFLDVVEGRAAARFDVDDAIQNLKIVLDARDRGPHVIMANSAPVLDTVPVVIQARMGSTRLPGKVLKHAAGKSMIELLVERLRRARRVGGIYIATSDLPGDDPICETAARLGIPVFRGSEQDVLARYIGAVRAFDLPAVVRITADCPLHDPDIVDNTIGVFIERRPDYCSNIFPRTVPDGLDVEVISRRALETAFRDATETADREHVTRYIYRHPERFEIASALPLRPGMVQRRWTLDTPADYDLIRSVFEALYPEKPDFRTADILDYLAQHPHLEAALQVQS